MLRLALALCLVIAPALADESAKQPTVEAAISEAALNLAMLYRLKADQLAAKVADLEKKLADAKGEKPKE